MVRCVNRWLSKRIARFFFSIDLLSELDGVKVGGRERSNTRSDRVKRHGGHLGPRCRKILAQDPEAGDGIYKSDSIAIPSTYSKMHNEDARCKMQDAG